VLTYPDSSSVKQEESSDDASDLRTALQGGGKKLCSTAATHGTRGKRRRADPAKTAVMAYMERLVRDGLAWRSETDSGAIELTLSSGEVFHIGETSFTRII
jgi:hypothetical protein